MAELGEVDAYPSIRISNLQLDKSHSPCQVPKLSCPFVIGTDTELPTREAFV